MVHPEDANLPRWSDNWESNSARKYTQWNLPGNIHQDDIRGEWRRPAIVPPGNPLDKQKYPDFAILAQSWRSYRYRKLYRVNFTTNEGDTDVGRAIYSIQATHRGTGGAEETYCEEPPRLGDYKSCMFSKVEACYNYAFITKGRSIGGSIGGSTFGSAHSLSVAAQQNPGQVTNGREVARAFLRSATPALRRLTLAAVALSAAAESAFLAWDDAHGIVVAVLCAAWVAGAVAAGYAGGASGAALVVIAVAIPLAIWYGDEGEPGQAARSTAIPVAESRWPVRSSSGAVSPWRSRPRAPRHPGCCRDAGETAKPSRPPGARGRGGCATPPPLRRARARPRPSRRARTSSPARAAPRARRRGSPGSEIAR